MGTRDDEYDYLFKGKSLPSFLPHTFPPSSVFLFLSAGAEIIYFSRTRRIRDRGASPPSISATVVAAIDRGTSSSNISGTTVRADARAMTSETIIYHRVRWHRLSVLHGRRRPIVIPSGDFLVDGLPILSSGTLSHRSPYSRSLRLFPYAAIYTLRI